MTGRPPHGVSHLVAALPQASTFTTHEAEMLGVPRQRLARAANSGRLHRVARGHYVVRDDSLAQARHHIDRLQRRGIPAVLGSISAARFWAIPVFGSTGPIADAVLTLLVPRGLGIRQGTRHGLRLAVADLSPADVFSTEGVPMTRPLRTGLDVARDVGRCRASALIPLSGGMRAEGAMLMSTGRAASALEVTERFLRDEELLLRLHAELREMTERVNSRGMTWVRRVIDDVEPLLETALEGLAWAAITAAGLANARPQQWVFGRSGRRYRVDFLIGGNVVLEADGSGKYSEQTPWQEKQRQSDLEAAGYWVVRCTWDEIHHRPQEVIARIREQAPRSLSA
ncbi:MAG: DUF559 domain-containing protein [Candidatus Nanopelagicales bacterium]